MEDDEQRTRHGTEGQEALRKVGYALLYHVRALELPMAFVVAAFVVIVNDFGDAQ